MTAAPAPASNRLPGEASLSLEEDLILSMRYYSDDKERARWAKDFPDIRMPAKEKPPFDRDRRLPKSEL